MVDDCPTDNEILLWLRVAACALPKNTKKAKIAKQEANNFLNVFMLILKDYY